MLGEASGLLGPLVGERGTKLVVYSGDRRPELCKLWCEKRWRIPAPFGGHYENTDLAFVSGVPG